MENLRFCLMRLVMLNDHKCNSSQRHKRGPSLPSIPQTGGRRQTNTQEGGGGRAKRENYNTHSIHHTHTHTHTHRHAHTRKHIYHINVYNLSFLLTLSFRQGFWKAHKSVICFLTNISCSQNEVHLFQWRQVFKGYVHPKMKIQTFSCST